MGETTEYHQKLLRMILDGEITDKDGLQRAKIELCRRYALPGVPRNSDTLALASEEEFPLVLNVLRRKPVRTLSGVAVVAVMTSPAPCPHGKCIFCPGGVDNNSPQSYTGKEPAALRGANFEFDPEQQVRGRMQQLETIGHGTEKVDLIIMGGTFTSRERAYQDEFVKRCFDGLNGIVSTTLTEAQEMNETSEHRCIGMTIETRPDQFTPEICENVLRLGTTRVEFGVQILDDTILSSVNRGHSVSSVTDATKVAKDAGIKVCYHVMPGLPGSSMEKDVGSFRTMFEDERFRPDMVKIYPTLVVKGTKLYDLWLNGEYQPLDTEAATETISEMLRLVPRWARIQRIQRDIPVPLIEAGVDKGHLRELAEARLRQKGETCHCIRCREVGLKGITAFERKDVELRIESYRASGGIEDFISLELPEQDGLVGFVRLRRGEGTEAMVRELKVFGLMAKIGQDGNVQHRGFGKELLSLAEQRAKDHGYDALRVTSGVGVRRYYVSLGYARKGPYMAKGL
ncbi:MAG TPA: tRNA uridine(34) 5-carboxymethylaminomethyl modification radical SAM/GNAT enzyme Elp3 [Methanomassiliicoccales archaeon]|jgi:elongator complex protein 3